MGVVNSGCASSNGSTLRSGVMSAKSWSKRSALMPWATAAVFRLVPQVPKSVAAAKLGAASVMPANVVATRIRWVAFIRRAPCCGG
ncbi:hypothetical protein D3C71_1286510 [compost metagenome]